MEYALRLFFSIPLKRMSLQYCLFPISMDLLEHSDLLSFPKVIINLILTPFNLELIQKKTPFSVLSSIRLPKKAFQRVVFRQRCQHQLFENLVS